ncbi:MAG: hypothetical protein KKA73_29670 [Chloroflexi bacterium]|nr:hypothetical protein [Chloroflexota bacterium]MBU1751867.1 hypothetical protein [Chloroflexota bacterium]
MTFPSIELYLAQQTTALGFMVILLAIFVLIWLWNRCSKRFYGTGVGARPLVVAAIALYVGILLLVMELYGFVTTWQNAIHLSEVAELRVELVDKQKSGVPPTVVISDCNLIQAGLGQLSPAVPGGFENESRTRFFVIRFKMMGASEYSSNYIVAVDRTTRREGVSIVIPTYDSLGIQTETCWFECPQFLDWLHCYVEPLLTRPAD